MKDWMYWKAQSWGIDVVGIVTSFGLFRLALVFLTGAITILPAQHASAANEEYVPQPPQEVVENRTIYSIFIGFRGCDGEECDRIILSCEKNGYSKVHLPSLPDREVSDLVLGQSTGFRFLVDGKQFQIFPAEMTFNDMNSSWDISGWIPEKSFLDALAKSKAPELVMNGRHVRIVRNLHLERFAVICRTEAPPSEEVAAPLRPFPVDQFWICKNESGETGEVRTTVNNESGAMLILSKQFRIRDNYESAFCQSSHCSWGSSVAAEDGGLEGDVTITNRQDSPLNLEVLTKSGLLHCSTK